MQSTTGPKQITPEELQSLEFPYGRSVIMSEHKRYDYGYDEPIESRVFTRHFKPLAIAQQSTRPRPITMEVQSISRLRHRGREFLIYNVSYKSEDWRHNPINFSPSLQGTYKVPKFRADVDVNTNEIKTGTAQIESVRTVYDIPFSKEKAEELIEMYSEEITPGPSNLTVVDSSGRRHSCSRKEFTDREFDDLVNLKTGFTSYMEANRSSKKK